MHSWWHYVTWKQIKGGMHAVWNYTEASRTYKNTPETFNIKQVTYLQMWKPANQFPKLHIKQQTYFHMYKY